MTVRRGLGRGLGALIPSAPSSVETPAPPVSREPELTDSATVALSPSVESPAPVQGAHFAEIPVTAITPNPRQPRQVFDEEALAELVHSIKEIGLLQPVVVRRTGPEKYELVMGERRWRASQEAGLSAIPAIVRDTGDDVMLRDALLENLHRAQLNPLEEAAAYGQLLEDFGCTHDELAQRIGRSRPQITNTLRLLKLPPSVQRRVAAGVLSAGHARAILAAEGEETQEHLAHRVVAEGLSVRALEEIVTLSSGKERRTKVSRRTKPVAPRLADLEHRLADRYDTRVKVDLGKSKGKIVVEFASLEDLERIITLMDPPRPEATS
ncbi:ParB/RepB/Spo0J family partition protein [Actinopolymorpha alba]|uniref:ParB/RepB/Spo0J family partition protein n=1 Tax=Actinopolymorpha alba TaxID=533267 RepID=UPI00039ABA43|nr:ParB/RepB/Spo0J family partition protein [Actinopolymorpha alba]